MRWLLLVLLLVLLLCSCTATFPTPAIIARLNNNNFQVCTIRLQWTVDQLTSECGEPDKIVSNDNGDIECFIYTTEAVTFAGGQGAPVVAACLSRRESEFQADGKKRKNVKDSRRIVEVTGLRSIPGKPSMASPAIPPRSGNP